MWATRATVFEAGLIYPCGRLGFCFRKMRERSARKGEGECWGGQLLFFFEDNVLDPDRCELRCKGALVSVEPQVFDLIVFLIRNRDRVVSKGDLIAGVWDGRIVSDSTLASRIN